MKRNCVFFILLFMVFAGSALVNHAEEIYVTKTEDTNNPYQVGNVSLREAISRANANGETNIIFLPAGTYTLTIEGANENQNAAGDLDIYSNVTIQGAGAEDAIIQAGTTPGNDYGEGTDAVDRVFHITTACNVIFTGITIRYGKAPNGQDTVTGDAGNGANGGGIYTVGGILTLNHCIVYKNRSGNGGSVQTAGGGTPGNGGSGGGIYCGTGSLTLAYCAVSNNYVGWPGFVPPYDMPQYEGGKGGGIYCAGQTSISHCTIDSNRGIDSGYNGHGGGIYNSGNMTITDSTISGNESTYGFYEGGYGGGIYNDDGGMVYLTNCTVAKNSAGPCQHVWHGGLGGGIYNHENGNVYIKNTIIADNEAEEVPPEEVEEHGLKGPDFYGKLRSMDFNLVENTETCTITGYDFHNITGQDPMLEPLADNGGVTKTHALNSGSPAIDKGSGKGFTSDQRGYARPVNIPMIPNADDGSDIGAYEYFGSSTIGEITLDRQTLYFTAAPGSISTDPQTFSFKATGTGTLNWFVSPGTKWISVSPLSGTGNGRVSVSVDPSGLTPGTYNGTVSVVDEQASNSPQTVQVVLTVYSEGTSTPPFGEFSTPGDGSSVSGSIAVTGWALDDIGVDSVKIYRGTVTGEAGDRAYIGEAVFVEGARPDVEITYPQYPFNYAAGWGYMLLTNFLPNGGNGTFTLYAVTVDKEGNEVTLGEKTITCDNANAVKPFGALDTPGQGGTASGKHYVNFGWALTPLPNKIAEDGSFIRVWVDGLPIGHPVYNIFRADIASLFPGYNNSNGAVGYYYLDTTAYSNGVHTISWTAEDNAGNSDGIGSRYFTIQNFQSDSASAGQTANNAQSVRNEPTLTLSHIPVDYFAPVGVKKGYNRKCEPQRFYPDGNGTIFVEINELTPLEIRLVSVEEQGLAHPAKYTGCQVVNGQTRRLPIGSTLDTDRGVFYWQPGPGFLGEYDFAFIKKHTSGGQERKTVVVRIIPKFKN